MKFLRELVGAFIGPVIFLVGVILIAPVVLYYTASWWNYWLK